MNRSYNKFNIFFKYNGITAIGNSDLALQINPCGNPSSGCNYAQCNPADYPNHTPYFVAQTIINNNEQLYVEQNSINVYVMKESVCFGGSSWRATRLSVSDQGFTGGTIVHEVGHSLGLSHTFLNFDTNNCEQVTRDVNDIDDPNDPNDTYWNADIAGDRVVDTNAIPILNANEYPNTFDLNTCAYTGSGVDCKGTPYQITTADVTNAMAYANGCNRSFLTVGQGIRMREYIASTTAIHYAATTIESLYLPYKGSYYYAGPLTEEHRPLFQPGFDYKFVKCSGYYPQPAAYSYPNVPFNFTTQVVASYGKFETDFNQIMHPNHSAIRILQLEPNGVSVPPQRCYNNTNQSPTPIGGSVTKFNDGVINQNVTVQQKDSTEINNQYLVNDLESGLYKIERDFGNGENSQTIIYKSENN